MPRQPLGGWHIQLQDRGPDIGVVLKGDAFAEGSGIGTVTQAGDAVFVEGFDDPGP